MTQQIQSFYLGVVARSSFKLIYCVLYDTLQRCITAIYLQVLYFILHDYNDCLESNIAKSLLPKTAGALVPLRKECANGIVAKYLST